MGVPIIQFSFVHFHSPMAAPWRYVRACTTFQYRSAIIRLVLYRNWKSRRLCMNLSDLDLSPVNGASRFPLSRPFPPSGGGAAPPPGGPPPLPPLPPPPPPPPLPPGGGAPPVGGLPELPPAGLLGPPPPPPSARAVVKDCVGVIVMVVILVGVSRMLASLSAADCTLDSGGSGDRVCSVSVRALRRLVNSSCIGRITHSVRSSPLNLSRLGLRQRMDGANQVANPPSNWCSSRFHSLW